MNALSTPGCHLEDASGCPEHDVELLEGHTYKTIIISDSRYNDIGLSNIYVQQNRTLKLFGIYIYLYKCWERNYLSVADDAPEVGQVTLGSGLGGPPLPPPSPAERH